MFLAALYTAFFLVPLFLILRRHRRVSLPPLPPGPKKLPILGNLLQYPKVVPWETYNQWCKDIGSDIIHLSIFGTNIIILNSNETATDLLHKRSAIYSSRARAPMVGELMGWNFSFIFMPYGDQWRAHRRLFYEDFNATASQRFEIQELRYTHTFLLRVLDNPVDFMDHLHRMTASVIVAIAYGLEAEPYMSGLEENIRGITTAAATGRFLVDSMPILKYVPDWFPGAGFKRQAKIWSKLREYMRDAPFAAAKRKFEGGVENSSFTSYRLRDMDRKENIADQECTIRDVAGTMYTAGSDTTYATILIFILAMLSNPDAQRNAQVELDSVLKDGTMPQFEDRESRLPYVTALVKEVFRWRGAAPLGLAHLVEVEDIYHGYRIPAGSIILPNLWAILHDEGIYPDPLEFQPERFMRNGQLDPDMHDPLLIVFGIGRRICPGRHMAYSLVWIAIASILTVFDITKAVDENGSVIEPTPVYTSGTIMTPSPFKCSIRPRSKESAVLIRSSAEIDK